MKAWLGGGLVAGGAALGALAMWLLVPAMAPSSASNETAATTENESAAGTDALSVEGQAQQKAGIKVAPVDAATRQGSRSGFARALDLTPLASLAADADAARVAVMASQREVNRLAALARQDQSAAPKDLEAAQSQLAADRSKLTLACQSIGLSFGAGLARRGCDAITGLAREAAAGRLALIRIDMTNGAPPTAGRIEIGEGADRMSAQVLGPAANVDAQLQTPGALAIVRGASAVRLGVGRVLPVHLDDGRPVPGVLVPRAALMRAAGGQFVYRAQDATHFTRAALSGGTPMAGGWFFSDNVLKPRDRIVVAGATTLLGLERGGQDAGGD